MKRTFAAVAALALLLAGCSSESSEPPVPTTSAVSAAPASSVPATVTTSAAAAPALSVRGNIEKTLGDRSGWGCEDYPTEPCDVDFTISAPVPATGCSDQYTSENGSVVAFPVDVTTREGIDATFYREMWNPNGFSVVDAGGRTRTNVATAAIYSCDQSDEALTAMSPGSVYESFVVLDIPVDSAILVFRPTNDGSSGWEWPLPPIA